MCALLHASSGLVWGPAYRPQALSYIVVGATSVVVAVAPEGEARAIENGVQVDALGGKNG